MDLKTVIAIGGDLYMVLLGVVALLILWKYKYYKQTSLRYFIVFVFLALIIETLGLFFGNMYGYNGWLYNIYNIYYFIYLFVLFSETILNYRYKIVGKICIVLFSLSIVWALFSEDLMVYSSPIIYVTGATLAICCIVSYYVDLLQSDLVMELNRNTLFWISVGFLLFFVGYIPIKLIYMLEYDAKFDYTLFRIIQLTLLIIMNICFIVGFLISKPKSSQSQ